MIYTNLTRMAMRLCFEKHKEQLDRSGVPYVFHPYHVAESMTDEYTTCVALLHDIVEDTNTTLEDLEEMGFPKEIVDAVDCMTHREGVDYFDYIAVVKSNPIAIKVKISDLIHNSDLTRNETVTEHDLERNRKYSKALQILRNH